VENLGNNVTYKNISLYNKSGIYTYYETDVDKACIILITTKNPEIIEHILDTMTKPELNVESNPFNMTADGLVTADTDNDNNSDVQKTTKTNFKKKTSSSSSDTIFGEKIDERHDFAGNPDYEYIGTSENIYIKNRKTGEIAKRQLDYDEGAYYFEPV
jgi:hypothetical protein